MFEADLGSMLAHLIVGGDSVTVGHGAEMLVSGRAADKRCHATCEIRTAVHFGELAQEPSLVSREPWCRAVAA